jgi:hypothetical protein
VEEVGPVGPERVGVVYPRPAGTAEGHRSAGERFQPVCEAFERLGVHAELIPYADEVVEEVRGRLRALDGVLVWVNPIEGGRSRAVLDAMLRDVASAGVFVSAHPDVILRMGTKDVLVETQGMPWCSGDVCVYRSVDELRLGLRARLSGAGSRVLKQYRGNGGDGVWRVALARPGREDGPDPVVRVLHALRGSPVEEIPLSAFAERCRVYFQGGGHVIDQPFHAPGPRGMIRCYMTHGRVVGFGQQHVTALLWSDEGAPPPPPEPRRYYPPTLPEFQDLRSQMESTWIPELRRRVGLAEEELPVIWDADFLCGPEGNGGAPDYVLCEINVSSVYPFPESALPELVEATVRRIRARA